MKPDKPSSETTTTTPNSPSSTPPKDMPLGYYSSLSLDHAPNTPQQSQPQPTPEPVIEAPKKKHRLKRSLTIVAVILVLFIGYSTVRYAQVLNVSVDDLVTEHTQNTSYLRPRQWKYIGADNTSGYGNKLGGNGKSSAIVMMTTPVTYTINSLENDGGEYYFSRLREAYVNQFPPEELDAFFKLLPGECNSKNTIFTKEIDTVSTPTTIGLFRLNATCTQAKEIYTIKLRGIAGRDGHVRLICIIAPAKDWGRNTEAFEKMLNDFSPEPDQTT